MIKVNNITINQNHFPDGSLRILDFPILQYKENIFIKWNYENDAELFTLICVVNHLRNNWGALNKTIGLEMAYIPHARMDRTKSNTEVFTLKYFCDVINSLKFDYVRVLDPHSYVSEALINNLIRMDVETGIIDAIDDIEGKDIDGGEKYGGTTVIYFPDDGAMKRYKGLNAFCGHKLIYGKKVRDWKTGKINGLTIHSEGGELLTEFGQKPLTDAVVLMIDDIISYGGTLAYSADALKELGAQAIYAYASHTENSVLDEENGTLIKRLNSGIVDGLFTTDSIYSGKHPRISVLKLFKDDD